MQKQSRRQFTQWCASLTMTGLIPPVLSLFLKSKHGMGQYFMSNLFKERDNVNSSKKNIMEFKPAYLKLHKSGELKQRGEELWNIMKECKLCPRKCRVNRIKGETGVCQASSDLKISSVHPHFGEETPLVGQRGSGTIFFANCSLRCVFCINWDISHEGRGKYVTLESLAENMLALQKMGCHNINVVTPTHYSPHIVLALDIAAGQGLKLPVVYNTCGWEHPDISKYLDGIVDIYLPDFKYSSGNMAAKYSNGAKTYPEVTKTSLMEMHRQVGVAKPAENGLMYRGLMIRHLVMPNDVSGTKGVIEWIAQNLPKDTYLNLMSQYRPMYKAFDYPEISRRISKKEYSSAVNWAKKAGLTNLDIQGAG